MDIKYCETASLIPYAKNSRTHSDAQIAQIAGSIREFGFPIRFCWITIMGSSPVMGGSWRL